jgi:hypothetical protein
MQTRRRISAWAIAALALSFNFASGVNAAPKGKTDQIRYEYGLVTATTVRTIN